MNVQGAQEEGEQTQPNPNFGGIGAPIQAPPQNPQQQDSYQ